MTAMISVSSPSALSLIDDALLGLKAQGNPDALGAIQGVTAHSAEYGMTYAIDQVPSHAVLNDALQLDIYMAGTARPLSVELQPANDVSLRGMIKNALKPTGMTIGGAQRGHGLKQ